MLPHLVVHGLVAFMAPAAIRPQLSLSKVGMSGGKGFGGGEATRDPAPTYVDPNDPKGKQQAIHKAESFADYLAKRGGSGGAAVGGAYPNLPPSVHPGVLTGQAVTDLLNDAKARGYAIPAVNCVTSSSVNACLEAAAKAQAPIMIQFSSGGSQFYAGKGLDNTNYKAAVDGAVAGAYHVRRLAASYGVPVILHTDHCAKSLLPWVDGMLAESEAHYAAHGEPLFSSHMLDLSEEPLGENIEICVEYMERMAKMDMLLEMELGITGGEEDGVDNENANPEDLYTKPEEVWMVQRALQAVPNAKFTIAAAFGNVHGVYAPGNVKLDPKILRNSQVLPHTHAHAHMHHAPCAPCTMHHAPCTHAPLDLYIHDPCPCPCTTRSRTSPSSSVCPRARSRAPSSSTAGLVQTSTTSRRRSPTA